MRCWEQAAFRNCPVLQKDVECRRSRDTCCCRQRSAFRSFTYLHQRWSTLKKLHVQQPPGLACCISFAEINPWVSKFSIKVTYPSWKKKAFEHQKICDRVILKFWISRVGRFRFRRCLKLLNQLQWCYLKLCYTRICINCPLLQVQLIVATACSTINELIDELFCWSISLYAVAGLDSLLGAPTPSPSHTTIGFIAEHGLP